VGTKLRGKGVNNARPQAQTPLILRRPLSRVGDGELQGVPYLRAQTDFAWRADVLDDVRHQLIDDQSQRYSHVSRHIYALDTGRDPIGTTRSSTDFATQIAEEGVETHDACILTRVETLMDSRNC
jgi:hypothetical protein